VRFHPVAAWWGLLLSALTFVFVQAGGLLVALLLSMNSGPDWETPDPGTGLMLILAVIDLIGCSAILMTITPNTRYRYIDVTQLGVIWQTGRDRGAVSWTDIECITVKGSEADDIGPPNTGRRCTLAWIRQRDGRVVPLPLNSGYPGARLHARHVARRLVEFAPFDMRPRLRA
jgi:hypothetical protein